MTTRFKYNIIIIIKFRDVATRVPSTGAEPRVKLATARCAALLSLVSGRPNFDDRKTARDDSWERWTIRVTDGRRVVTAVLVL